MKTWPFGDPPNVAVFTSKKIIERGDWSQRATHDAEDGAWRFHSPGGAAESEALIVSLEEITRMNPTVLFLANLPLGGCAWRETKAGPWNREKL